MDWPQVMSRPDYTIEEKRALYEADCARRGLKPYPEAYKVKGGRDA